MQTQHFFRSGTSLAQGFAELPPSTKEYLKRGFDAVVGLDPALYSVLLQIAARSYEENTYGTPIPDIATKLNLAADVVPPMLAATTTLLVALTQFSTSAGEFVQVALNSETISESTCQALTALGQQAEADRVAFRGALSRAELSRDVFPSLWAFETTVDLRIGFSDKRPATIAPVVLVHVDTDAGSRELWFQMSKAQLETMINHLQRVRDDVVAAEQLIKLPLA